MDAIFIRHDDAVIHRWVCSENFGECFYQLVIAVVEKRRPNGGNDSSLSVAAAYLLKNSMRLVVRHLADEQMEMAEW